MAGVVLTTSDNPELEAPPAPTRRRPGLVACLAVAACLQLALIATGLMRQQAPPRDALVLPSVGATITTPQALPASPTAGGDIRPNPTTSPTSSAEGDIRPNIPASPAPAPQPAGSLQPASPSPAIPLQPVRR